jgi:hypothetical protein
MRGGERSRLVLLSLLSSSAQDSNPRSSDPQKQMACSL